ncbi:hypothetical protein JTB14_004004 [Gonioctena quinquepunctata]|nr:hypothetical protein JTB14_004004 [Gonioctena quinquepunctata]
MNQTELGCTNIAQMDIINNDVTVRTKPYRNSSEDRKEIAKIVRNWTEAGIVKDTNPAYASPIFLVGKKNGQKRLVVDFRKLIMQTIELNILIPQFDEQFEGLSGCTLFLTLDFASGYHRVPLTEKTQGKTAFITNDDTGQFT